MKNLTDLPGWLLFLVSSALLLLLGMLSWSGEEDAFERKLHRLQHPHEYESSEICLGYLTIDSLTARSVQASDRAGNAYRFYVDPSGFQTGERYSFRGHIMRNGMIRVADYLHHPQRQLKYAFSLLSLLPLIYLIARYIRFDRNTRTLMVVHTDRGLFGSGGKEN